MRKMGEHGIALLHAFEGCSLKAYKIGTDKVTIGWGNTYYEDGSPIKLGDKISQKRADELFTTILNRDFVPPVDKLVPKNLAQNQFDALVSFAYNAGMHSLKKAKFLKLLSNPKDPDIWRIWRETNILKGSQFEKGLRRRRLAEANLFFTP